MNKIYIFLVFTSLFIVSSTFKVNNIILPELVFVDSIEPIVLDCDFDAEEITSDMVVKWFHDEKPIYQWIFGRQPQGIGKFRDILDLNYKVTNGKHTTYRALKINHVNLNLTGIYKCVVFTYKHEDEKSKKMIVIDRPEAVELTQINPDQELVQFICNVYNIYPEPNIHISNSQNLPYDDIEKYSTQSDDKLYNVTQIVTVKSNELDKNTKFSCIISIPDTPYMLNKTLMYYDADNAASITSNKLWLVLLFISIIIYFQK